MVSFEVAVIVLIAGCIGAYVLGLLHAPEPDNVIGTIHFVEDISEFEETDVLMEFEEPTLSDALKSLDGEKYAVVLIKRKKYDSTQKKHGI